MLISRSVRLLFPFFSIALIPLLAAPDADHTANVAGMLVMSKDTRVAGAPATIGGTVLSGDTVDVGASAAEIQTRSARVILGPATHVTFLRDQNRVSATLASGEISFSEAGTEGAFQVSSGNVTVRGGPAGGSDALVDLREDELNIAARKGTILVSNGDDQVALEAGQVVRFYPADAGGGSGGGQNPPPQASTHSRWGALLVCVVAGAAVGAIPVIASEQSASAEPDWQWGLIPAGAIGGGLICGPLATRQRHCTLKAEPTQVYPGQSVTLTWRSPRNYKANLSGVGPEPYSGSTTVVPTQPGRNTWDLTAKGNGETLVCATDVVVLAAAEKKKPPPWCDIWYTIDANQQIRLNWETKNTDSAELESYTFPVGKDPDNTENAAIPTGNKDIPSETMYYRVLASNSDYAKPFPCSVSIYPPACSDMTATARKKPSPGFNLAWKYRNGKATLEPPTDPDKKESVSLTDTSGTASVFPSEPTVYSVTVTKKMYTDSRKKNATVEMSDTCSVAVSPVSCTLTVSPNQAMASAKKPATIKLEWATDGGEKPVLQTWVNNKPSGKPQSPPPATMDVTQTTEFEVSVTGPNGEVATCRDCVLVRPEKDGKAVGKVLDIKPIFQRNTMWCWATVAQMIFQYYAVPDYKPKPKPPANTSPDKLYQWGVISSVLPGCASSPDRCWSIGGQSWLFLQNLLQQYPPVVGRQEKKEYQPIRSQAMRGCLTADQVKREIDAGRPIEVGISPGAPHPPAAGPVPALQVPNSQHVALIIGYREENGKLQLIINDPWPYKYRQRVKKIKEPNPYLDKDAGTQNCEANYTIDVDKFCANAGWQSSLIGIQK